jgi:recombination protein RecT
MSNEITLFEKALMDRSDKFASALPQHVDAARFIRCATNLVTVNKGWLDPAKYDQGSLFMALMNAAQTGLEPDPQYGHIYMVPRWNRSTGKSHFQCQLGYRGMIHLAYQSQKVLDVSAGIVRKGDDFDYQEGTDCFLRYKKLAGMDQPITHAWAMVRLAGGVKSIKVMSVEEINAIRDKCSDAAKKEFSPWNKFYEAMCMKTVVRPLLKLKPISLELTKAITIDEDAEREHEITASVSTADELKAKMLSHNPLKPVVLENLAIAENAIPDA